MRELSLERSHCHPLRTLFFFLLCVNYNIVIVVTECNLVVHYIHVVVCVY